MPLTKLSKIHYVSLEINLYMLSEKAIRQRTKTLTNFGGTLSFGVFRFSSINIILCG